MALSDPAPFSGDRYHENSARCEDGLAPCAICGKPVKRPAGHVYVHDGGATFVTPEEYEAKNAVSSAGEMGGWPIGSDCLRRYPALRPYVVKE